MHHTSESVFRIDVFVGGVMCLTMAAGLLCVARMLEPKFDESSPWKATEFAYCNVEKINVDSDMQQLEVLVMANHHAEEVHSSLSLSLSSLNCKDAESCLLKAQIAKDKNLCLFQATPASGLHLVLVHDPTLPFENRVLQQKLDEFEVKQLFWVQAFQWAVICTTPLCCFSGCGILASLWFNMDFLGLLKRWQCVTDMGEQGMYHPVKAV